MARVDDVTIKNSGPTATVALWKMFVEVTTPKPRSAATVDIVLDEACWAMSGRGGE